MIIVEICSLCHAILHIQTIFLVLPVSLKWISFFCRHKQKSVPLQEYMTHKLKLLES